MPKEEKKKVNVIEKELPVKPLTVQEIKLNTFERLERIHDEFKMGFDAIMNHPKSASIFGSARFKEDNPHYKKAQSIGRKLSEIGFSIVTGGGPGIMEAGNRGAQEGDHGKSSIAFSIELPFEQATNPYVDSNLNFHYFFSRKVLLSFSAEAYLFFPGGFGTLDEFFEIITLVQTKKIPKVPIILVGDDYWGKLEVFMKEYLRDKYETIDDDDIDLYTITEDEDKIVEIVKNAPLRNE